VLIRLPFALFFGDKTPYITFYPGIGLAAYFGGFGPGLVSTLISAVAVVLFVTPPFGSFSFRDIDDVASFAIFLAVGAFLSFLSGRLHVAQEDENALRILFQQTLTSIADAVISTDGRQRILLMNPLAEQLTGWTQAEARGRPLAETLRLAAEGTDIPVEIPIKPTPEAKNAVNLVSRTELIARNGNRIPVEGSVAPIQCEDGRIAGVVLTFRDIGERLRTERKLGAAERRAQNILESISDAFMLLDSELRIVQVNPAAEKILRIPAAALLGKVYREVVPAMEGMPLKDALRKAAAERVPVQLEIHYQPRDLWLGVNGYPSAEGLAVYFRDITERKRNEAALQRLNEDLKQFTFAATHDLREPLRTVTAFVQLLQRKLAGKLDEQTSEYIQYIVAGTRRMARLIDGLLQFSSLGEIEGQAAPVDAEAALQDALGSLQAAVSEAKAEIQHETLPWVMSDAVRVSQLFQNLIGNALKYRAPERPPRIKIRAERSGNAWVFAIQDNGIGIAPQYQEQIFAPFKRLHASGVSGAGIGLAACKRIVERYGGRIWVDSKEGEGSTFFFSLPAAESGGPRTAPAEARDCSNETAQAPVPPAGFAVS
jgi:PAS domain S-box-containing protein